MKKLVSIILLSLFFMVGCQDDNSILEPTNDLSDFSLNKGRRILDYKNKDLDDFSDFLSNYNIVLGYTGGDIPFNYDAPNGFSVEGNITIPEGAYFGLKQFSVEFDMESYSAHFYPSPTVFDVPLILDMKFSELDLTGVDPDVIAFSYIGLDGILETAECKSIRVDVKKGTLEVVGAKLPHFSRYGWTRSK